MCGLELVAVVQLWAFYNTTTGTSHTTGNAVFFVVSRVIHRLLRIISSGLSPHCAFDTGVKYGLPRWLCTPLTDHFGAVACASPYALACSCGPGLFPCNAR